MGKINLMPSKRQKQKNLGMKKKSTKINFSGKCSNILNLLTVTPNVHSKKAASLFSKARVIFLMRSPPVGKRLANKN